ncbi:FAD-dependent oxidoreductase [bacterium]|nr:FAD-dependent oxidoreductase [bacterium]
MSHKTERTCDVLVIGGGMAGCAAAIAARRAGAQVILAERSGLLGGCTTLSLVQPWQSFHARPQSPGSRPRQLIKGIAQEFVDDLKALGGTPGHVPDPIGFAPTLTPVNTAVLAPYLVEKLVSEGIEVCLGRTASWVGSTRNAITSVTLAADNLEPLRHLRVRVGQRDRIGAVVDASGCAIVPRLVGGMVITPQRPQAWTHLFTMAGVRTDTIEDYIEERPRDFHLSRNWRVRMNKYFAVSGFLSLVNEARKSGEFPCPRDRVLIFGGTRQGEVIVNTTRVSPPEGYYSLPSTRRMRLAVRLRDKALRQVYDLVKWLRGNVPGFKKAELAQVAAEIGVRESYRIRGKYLLRGRDVVTGAKFPDAVTTAYYPVDIHSPGGSRLKFEILKEPYQIPLRALESRQFRNLFAAGRCLSADSLAFASARVAPIAMALGEAAGKAAAESIN